jgi:hypothetical protein
VTDNSAPRQPETTSSAIRDGMLEEAVKTEGTDRPCRAELEGYLPGALGESPRKALQSQRRRKLAWFLFVESIAVSAMIVSILAGFSLRFASESWTPAFRVLPVTAAIIATVLPILFYGNSRKRR